MFLSSWLVSCQDDDSFTKKVDFNITNALARDVQGKIYTTSDRVTGLLKSDSIDFAVSAGEATTVTWKKFDSAGDGLFQVYVSEELNQRFGYITNDVSLDGSFTIIIESDSIVLR